MLKGGEPDLNTAARGVLYDWQRGKIPFFKLPPDYEVREAGAQAVEETSAPPEAADALQVRSFRFWGGSKPTHWQ